MAKAFDPQRLKAMTRPQGMPFRITKIGHIVMQCRDIERTVRFYTEVLGFKVSDVYPDDMVPGGMVFMRYNSDHHGVGFVGALPGPSQNIELNHLAFQVATLDLATRQTQILTDSDKDESPSFAPNGRMILLATVISGRGVLSAVSADGRVKQRLTISAGDVREPAWGPFVR